MDGVDGVEGEGFQDHDAGEEVQEEELPETEPDIDTDGDGDGMQDVPSIDIEEDGSPDSTGPCAVVADTVLAGNAVGASWIPWDTPCLSDAQIAYTDRTTFNIFTMDEWGGHMQCLTCPGDNVLGVDFPLDQDGIDPEIHWKGGAMAHPTEPIILFKAENENSDHVAARNVPNVGWDNDIWALNVCTGLYSRLTNVAAGEGVQHDALSDDGLIYVFPLRYQFGMYPENFGYSSLSFNELIVDASGAARLTHLFDDEPNGQMYYEPNDLLATGEGLYVLHYCATAGILCDPYRYVLDCSSGVCARAENFALEITPELHEEFLIFSPSGARFALMKGPLYSEALGAYNADLYTVAFDYTGLERITYYNDCSTWSDRCLAYGGQLDRLDWKADGRAIFFGLWSHGAVLPVRSVDVHRLDFEGPCGD